MAHVESDGPTYSVRAIALDRVEFGERSFSGRHAASDADDYFDALKTHPDACEVSITRLDGNDWAVVKRVRRDESDEWQPIERGR